MMPKAIIVCTMSMEDPYNNQKILGGLPLEILWSHP